MSFFNFIKNDDQDGVFFDGRFYGKVDGDNGLTFRVDLFYCRFRGGREKWINYLVVFQKLQGGFRIRNREKVSASLQDYSLVF